MRTIRRLYFYTVSFITFEVVLWGMIGLLRSILSPKQIRAGGDALAQSLALILVGVPIFALHWLWAQRASISDEEEHSSSLRAVFLYGAIIGTLVPVVQNTLALVNRTLLTLSSLPPSHAIFGGSQTLIDNVIAILMNALVAAYFVYVLRRDWVTLSDTENFSGVRRLHRYLWLIYSLVMVLFGVQQIIRYLFYISPNPPGIISRDISLNGLSLLLVGAPIWYFVWKTCQDALRLKSEQGSLLRLGVLYLLSLAGVATVLSASGNVLSTTLRWILGESMTASQFITNVSGTVSIALPLGIVWGYYGHWLQRDIDAFGDESHRGGLRRLYYYILSLAGLVTAFTGMALIISFILDILVGLQIWGTDLRSRIAAAIATLVVGLPLWLTTWPRMQTQSRLQDEAGESSRQSVIRKTYLYLVIFASVIGGMISAVTVVFRLLQAALGSQALDIVGLLDALQLLVLFAIVLIYHFRCLRADGTEAARAQVERREKFQALAFERTGSGFGESILTSTQKQAPGLTLTVLASDAEIPEEAKSARAVVLPSDLAVNPPEKLKKFLAAFEGHILVSAVEHPRLIWTGGTRNPTEGAALNLRQLSDGQEIHQIAIGRSAWTVVAYVFAVLFGFELLMLLLSLIVSLVMG